MSFVVSSTARARKRQKGSSRDYTPIGNRHRRPICREKRERRLDAPGWGGRMMHSETVIRVMPPSIAAAPARAIRAPKNVIWRSMECHL